MRTRPATCCRPVQCLDADPLVQQGSVPRGGARPDAPPRTWPEVEAPARKLLAAGVRADSRALGRRGSTSRTWRPCTTCRSPPSRTVSAARWGARINSGIVVEHVASLADGRNRNLDYADRQTAPTPSFTAADAACTSPPRPHGGHLADAEFEVGYGLMPYRGIDRRAAQRGHRRRDAVGLKGRSEAEYKGVARFSASLSDLRRKPGRHQAGGYLPITKAAYELSGARGFYERNPRRRHRDQADTLQERTKNSKGSRLGSSC